MIVGPMITPSRTCRHAVCRSVQNEHSEMFKKLLPETTVVTTPANVADISQAHALIRPDDDFAYADSGYTGVEKRPEIIEDEHLSQVRWNVASRPSSIRGARGLSVEHAIESRKASVRSKVEHAFQIVKRQFGYGRCRYRGLAKNASALTVLFALSNVAMWARAGCPKLPAASPA